VTCCVFCSRIEGVKAPCFYPPVHLSVHHLITLQVFTFRVLFQRSEEVEVTRHKVWAVWWMGNTFPWILLQEYLPLWPGCTGWSLLWSSITLCEQATALSSEDVFQLPTHHTAWTLASSDLHLFGSLKKHLEDKHFWYGDMVKTKEWQFVIHWALIYFLRDFTFIIRA
jgi:hypothetical protein